MHLVAQRALQMTAPHAVIGLQVSDHRLDRLASLEGPDFELGEPLLLAPVLDLEPGVIGVHAAVASPP